MNDEQERIKISDLGLASLLVTLRFEMVGMERADAKRINFLFAQADGIEKVISDYWAGVEISVSAQSLFHSQKMLKGRLFGFK